MPKRCACCMIALCICLRSTVLSKCMQCTCLSSMYGCPPATSLSLSLSCCLSMSTHLMACLRSVFRPTVLTCCHGLLSRPSFLLGKPAVSLSLSLPTRLKYYFTCWQEIMRASSPVLRKDPLCRLLQVACCCKLIFAQRWRAALLLAGSTRIDAKLLVSLPLLENS